MVQKKVVWPTGTAEVRGGWLYYQNRPVRGVMGTHRIEHYDFADKRGGFAMTLTAGNYLREKMGKFKVRVRGKVRRRK